MRIIEINISEFGSLKNKVISPEAGMNVIYGENESGKSTILLFIKYMLYGLGRRSSSNSERERAISWSGHSASGNMTFEHGGSVYRIERRYSDGGREKLDIICLDDSSEIKTDKTPGEYFLGVPKEVFESSSFVGQMRSTKIDGERMAESIRNMLTSADESVDTSKILKGLDNVRVGYLHKNKMGGSIYDDEQRISEYRQRLERARDDALALEEEAAKLERARADYATVKRELEEKDVLLSEMNKIIIVERFNALDNKKTERADIAQKREALKAQTLKTEFFPTHGHIAELRYASGEFDKAKNSFTQKKEQFEEKNTSAADEYLAKLGESVEQRGGAQQILSLVSAQNKKSKTQNGVIAALWSAVAVASASAVMLILSNILFGAALFATFIPAVIFTVTGIITKKKCAKAINDIAAQYGATPETLAQRLDEAVNAWAQYRMQMSARIKLEAELENLQINMEAARVRLDSLLAKTSSGYPAEKEIPRLERFIAEYEKMMRDEDALGRMIDDEEKALRAYNYEEIRASISVDTSEITSTAISEAQRMRSFLVARKASFEQKFMNITNSIAHLKARAEDPLAIADKLAEAEDKLSADREFYDALTLAMESIEQAGQVMSGSVTPVISKRASEIIARISADKYKVLRTTGTLGVSLDSDGFGVKSDLLSEGTRDAAYLALRIALFSRIYGTELPPLMLDEALCQLDDLRAERTLLMLDELTREGVQCLCFTSHKREGEILKSKGVSYCDITL